MDEDNFSPNNEPSMLDIANEHCKDASDEIGQVTGAVYEAGANSTIAFSPIAEEIGQGVEDFVTEGWNDVCDLPENLYDNASEAATTISEVVSDVTETISDTMSDWGSGNNDIEQFGNGGETTFVDPIDNFSGNEP